MLFVGMLSFQLAGALILLLNGLKGTEDAVIKNCFPGSNIVERDEHDNCTIPKGATSQKCAQDLLEHCCVW